MIYDARVRVDGEHAVVKVGVMVWAEHQHVLGDVWAVVRVAEWFDVVDFGVPGVGSAL